MKKFVCLICGYVHEGDAAPSECPVCHAPASKFKIQDAEKSWAAEHVVGVAKGVDERIIEGFARKDIQVVHSKAELMNVLESLPKENLVGGFMSSGDFNGLTKSDLMEIYN